MTTAPSNLHRRRLRPALAGARAGGRAARRARRLHQPADAVARDHRRAFPTTIATTIRSRRGDARARWTSRSASTPARLTDDDRGQRRRLRARSSRPAAASLIAVVAPSGSPNQVAAAGIAVQVEDVLRQSGVNPRAIDYRVYQAGPEERNAPDPPRLQPRRRRTPRRAARGRIRSRDNGENRNYFDFGCATQQNLAAMVDNPLDLLYPRGLTPADAARRATVLDKYRKGEPFTADLSRETGGTVATGSWQPMSDLAFKDTDRRRTAKRRRRRRPRADVRPVPRISIQAFCEFARSRRRRSRRPPRDRRMARAHVKVHTGGIAAAAEFYQAAATPNLIVVEIQVCRATGSRPNSTGSPRSATPAPRSSSSATSTTSSSTATSPSAASANIWSRRST